MDDLESLVIARRLRVPIGAAAAGSTPGRGETAARQLDAALLSVGFTCSAALLERLSGLPGETVVDLGRRILAAVRRLVGDHVQHNAYFVDFPGNVPDTVEFWAGLLSLREHLQNRLSPAASRVFGNRHGRAWATPDVRPPLEDAVLTSALAILDEEVTRRLPDPGRLIVDPEVLDVALPLSGKAVAPGLGMLPRGSLSPVNGELLRFFVHWRQVERRTDYDLSALLLDASYGEPEHISWTNHGNDFGRYSGDVTDAERGASEFIDLRLAGATKPIIVPQVHVYAGEGFDVAAEAFFGYMTREAAQEGRPFEPRTVRMKSDLRGAGRVALPLVFLRGDDGGWRVKWLHLYLKGYPYFNQVEGNRVTGSLLVRSVVERDYLRVRHLAALLRAKGSTAAHTTYIGLRPPATLPADARVITPSTLHELIPG